MTYDIVIFGATGFTGQFVVEELAQVLASPDAPNLTWAVAGRNQGKLKKVGDLGRSMDYLPVQLIPRISRDQPFLGT